MLVSAVRIWCLFCVASRVCILARRRSVPRRGWSTVQPWSTSGVREIARVREPVCWDGADLRWRVQLPESHDTRPVGSCRRRFATVWWHTTGIRHALGVHVALRWLCETSSCSQGRFSSRRGQAQEGAHLSRADRTTCSGQIGGFSWRGRGSLV